jgi:copper transport protein
MSMQALGRRTFAVLARLLAVLTLAGGLVIAAATAASAHAVLEHTSPADGAVLSHAPTQVTLTFGEDVGVNSEDIQVFDDHLHRIDKGDGGHITGRGDTVGVHLPATLRNGTYTVTWRVISADSHPVAGGFTFSVGAPSQVTGTLSGLSGGHRSVGILLGTMRFLGYLGLVAGPGGLIFGLIWMQGRALRRTRRTIGAGIAVGALGAAGQFLVQAPYSQGESLGHLFDGGLLDGVAHSHFGRIVVIRFALWAILGVSAGLWWRGVRRASGLIGLAVLALPVTWALAGHGDIGSMVPLSLTSESLHVLAVTTWLGGLFVLATYLLRRSPDGEVFGVLPKFSSIALTCVGVILVTGLYQAWREVGLSWSAIIDTAYGRLVALKLLGLIALIGLGAFARWSLGSLAPRTDDPVELSLRQRLVRAHLKQSVFLELEVGVVVLILTGVLVNTIPAKDAVDHSVHRTLSAAGVTVDVAIAPGRVGVDTVTLTAFNGAGRPQKLDTASGSLDLPAKGIASLPVTFTTIKGSNRATATPTFALTGSWELTFEVQTSPVNAIQFTTPVQIH